MAQGLVRRVVAGSCFATLLVCDLASAFVTPQWTKTCAQGVQWQSQLPATSNFGAKPVQQAQRRQRVAGVQLAASAEQAEGTSTSSPQPVSSEWELDVYSRPVLGPDGKKLWELLVCDSTGQFRHAEEIASNMVNSREVRQRVEKLIDSSEVKPTMIRFFRSSMFNMINIALQDIDVAVKPARTTYALYQWLEQRDKEVYPKMPGYQESMKQVPTFEMKVPEALPDALRGEQYAFVGLSVEEFREGRIGPQNIGLGRLCPIDDDIPPRALIQGLLIITKRHRALAQWMSGLDVAFMKVTNLPPLPVRKPGDPLPPPEDPADMKKRELIMEVGIGTQYLWARVGDKQRKEAQLFEKGKADFKGLHFIAVQDGTGEADVAGFWLLKEVLA